MITIELNSVDITSDVQLGSIVVQQQITFAVDTASFNIRRTGDHVSINPEYGDEIEIYDGDEKVFGGTVVSVKKAPFSGAEGEILQIKCTDYTYLMDSRMAARVYENETITDIIDDLITSYAPGFTSNNVTSTFVIEKIVFNQVPLSQCIKRLAEITNYNWYVDENKDVHFFEKNTDVAPFNITDENGNYVYKTLQRTYDGTQVANRIKVRGGEYDGELYSDKITVVGNESKSFKLPYRFANLQVWLDTGSGPVAQNVGIDFINDFTTDDVLYNFNEQMIRWENELSDGDVISFGGNPKVPVFAIAEDPVSITEYGVREKLIRDNSIESNEVARRRANAELYTYAEPIVDARFSTYTPGLRAGMTMNISSVNQSFNEDLIIKGLTFRMRDHETFQYDVELISTKRYDFIALLQKILQPEPQPSDERETSEEIFTDTRNVQVVEGDYVIDPLGPNTDAHYVIGPYHPLSVDDPKRQGRLGISLKVI